MKSFWTKNALIVTLCIAAGYSTTQLFIVQPKPKATQREYTIILTRTPPPAQIIGRIQVGLTKAEAEGAAFQLNELFAKEKLEWKAIAAVQEDISTLPREKP